MSPSLQDFAELVSRSQAGDETAMAKLVTMYGKALRRAARVLIGAPLRPVLDSVDLVQSINIILLQGLRRNKVDVTSPEKLMALCLTLLRRRVARYWRRIKIDNAAVKASGAALAANSNRRGDPSQALQVSETLAELEEPDRRLVALRLWGYSTAEAARELGMDAAVLRVRLARLRKKLRDKGIIKGYF